MFSFWTKRPLYIQIFICVLIGILLGAVVPGVVPYISWIGDIFLRLLKMLIVPLTFLTLLAGILSLGDLKSLRSLGFKIVIMYAITSTLCVTFGFISGMIFQPGKEALGLLAAQEAAEQSSFSFIENIVSWVPENIFSAFSTDTMLQIIVFAVFLGGILLALGQEKVPTLFKVIREGSETMIKMTDAVMTVSPYGILALMASMVASLGSAMIIEVVKFIIADYVGLFFILVIVYPFILKIIAKVSPFRFFRNVAPAMLVAASTTSSAATLPVSLKCAEENVGMSEKVYSFGLPLGCTINMDGMACAIGVICVFAANLYDFPITVATVLQFVFLGLALSMGCAGVKGAGIVISTVLLQTLGMPLTLIPILAAIWPILDIGHTTLNITGDLMTCTTISARNGMLDEDIFYGRKTVDQV